MFGVVWLDIARDDLANIYVAASPGAERDVIEAAVLELERQLRQNAPGVGESRSGRRRIGFVPPLGFVFELDVAGRVAVIGRLWRYGRP
jgi:hypothetical protein